MIKKNLYIYSDAHSIEDWKNLEIEIIKLKPNLILSEFLQDSKLLKNNSEILKAKRLKNFKNNIGSKFFLDLALKLNTQISGIDLKWKWDEQDKSNFSYLGDKNIYLENGNLDFKKTNWSSMKLRENHWILEIEKYLKNQEFKTIVVIVGDYHLWDFRKENLGGENNFLSYFKEKKYTKIINLNKRYKGKIPIFNTYY